MSTNKNKPEIIKTIGKEKYQSMLKKFVMKRYENIIENINDSIIIGINNIRDSKIIKLIILDFSKPKILKTRF
tara:strand:- start:208 stop:426 length:219 start_codon:yes stop_codon:yes gene_type:complete